MLTLEEYLLDPCGTLSIPFWKAKGIRVPENMRIIHERDFIPAMAEGFRDTVYFRLYHDLQDIPAPQPSGFRLVTAAADDLEDIVSVINCAYDDLQVTREQIVSCTKTPVYARDLWVMAIDESSGEKVGSGLADFDGEAGELILEWIQVLPGYRRRGVGRAIVNELLRRKPEGARFATVSGRADSHSCPEALYRSCGFIGQDEWHILMPMEV